MVTPKFREDKTPMPINVSNGEKKMIRFDSIHLMLNKVALLSNDKAWLFSVDREVQEEIIRLNTIEQLYDQGIDSDGVSLGEYANFTKAEKIQKGDRYDHVTLKDTGAFYDSWIVRVNTKAILLDADDVGFYDRPLFEVYGEEVLGLTEDNMRWLKIMILDNYLAYVERELLFRG